jgi:hypothetical protein
LGSFGVFGLVKIFVKAVEQCSKEFLGVVLTPSGEDSILSDNGRSQFADVSSPF